MVKTGLLFHYHQTPASHFIQLPPSTKINLNLNRNLNLILHWKYEQVVDRISSRGGFTFQTLANEQLPAIDRCLIIVSMSLLHVSKQKLQSRMLLALKANSKTCTQHNRTPEEVKPHTKMLSHYRQAILKENLKTNRKVTSRRQFMTCKLMEIMNSGFLLGTDDCHGILKAAFWTSKFFNAHYFNLSPRCKFLPYRTLNVQWARLRMCSKEKCIKFHDDIRITSNGSKIRLKS